MEVGGSSSREASPCRFGLIEERDHSLAILRIGIAELLEVPVMVAVGTRSEVGKRPDREDQAWQRPRHDRPAIDLVEGMRRTEAWLRAGGLLPREPGDIAG